MIFPVGNVIIRPGVDFHEDSRYFHDFHGISMMIEWDFMRFTRLLWRYSWT